MKHGIKNLLNEILIFQAALRDPEVPFYIKLLLFLLVAYLLSPIDIIPDFIPVLGMLDEALLLPLAFMMIKRLIPAAVLARLRDQVTEEKPGRELMMSGLFLILLVWLLLILLSVWGYMAFSGNFQL